MLHISPNILKNLLHEVKAQRGDLIRTHGPMNYIRNLTEAEVMLREQLREVKQSDYPNAVARQ